MTTTTKKFNGTYHNTVFIRNLDTVGLQFVVEPSGPNSVFDLTIAAIDKEQKRTEYVLTASQHVLNELIKAIQSKINPPAKRPFA